MWRCQRFYRSVLVERYNGIAARSASGRYAADMKLSTVIDILETIAPLHLAEAWDKVGLHVGKVSSAVRNALLCIDLNEAVLDEAIEKKCQLVVAYHPPIFKPVERLVDDGRNWKQAMLLGAIEKRIAIYSPHTALDAVRGGMNDWLCDGLGKASMRRSIGSRVIENGLYKVVVFVPVADADQVRRAMSNAGAGWIGKYSECSFSATGFGTFKGEQGAKPAIGKVGKLEEVEELRLEMICYEAQVGDVVRACRDAHRYEEAAIDVFKLSPDFEPADCETGSGRIHELDKSVSVSTLVKRVKERLGVKQLKVAIPSTKKTTANKVAASNSGKGLKISKIGVCVGAGGSLFEKAGDCDAYITGEMQHHQVLDLVEKGKVVILAGHTNTERPFLPTYRKQILQASRKATGKQVDWVVSRVDEAPMGIV